MVEKKDNEKFRESACERVKCMLNRGEIKRNTGLKGERGVNVGVFWEGRRDFISEMGGQGQGKIWLRSRYQEKIWLRSKQRRPLQFDWRLKSFSICFGEFFVAT